MNIHGNDPIETAKSILWRRQIAELQTVPELAKKLRKEKAFRYAREVLALAVQEEEVSLDLRPELIRQQVLSTYKDPDLPPDERYDNALRFLEREMDREISLLDKAMYQEMLGLAGAIYKDKWEADGQKLHLERSLAYYCDAYKEGAASDKGYTGINAAFVLDQLANLEEATMPNVAMKRREEAKCIREDLIVTLPILERQLGDLDSEEKWWFYVTIAEAYFGLGRYEESLPWLNKAKSSQDGEVAGWQYESTASQLASLSRIQGEFSNTVAEFENSPPGRILREFLRDNTAAVFTSFVGKVGLALSGGGFRASLYHIGVLAKLAELDALRSVEVLSCVSGGSIIGAHYYLEVRKLLQEKVDSDITRQDYIEIVQRIADNFLAGVQQNIRMRVVAGPWTNIKMILKPDYSRTERVGELLEERIFSRVQDGERDRPRFLSDLVVRPKGEPETFHAKHDNWRRSAKVPILILNATTLNTGHNWQFTASWMGESPASIEPEIDSNYRLRRKAYSAPPENKMLLGHAVAASACVPGLFEPLVIDGLYPEKTVRLVDGGVHDNQGNVSLLEQTCTVLLVSDASGQMEAQDNPSDGLLGVPLRSNNILMARVRTAQHQDLAARRRSSLLRGLMFVHLKKGLHADVIDWIDCEDSLGGPRQVTTDEPANSLTDYGMRKDIQKRLAAIRTDLDSFADAEAYALMVSGYRATGYEFDKQVEGFPEPSEDQPAWHFLDIEETMRQAQESDRFMRLLDVASNRTFKIWRLSTPLRIIAYVLGVIGLVGLVWAWWTWWSTPILTVGRVGTAVVATIAALIVPSMILRVIQYRKTAIQIGIGIAMGLFGWIAAWIHLHLFDWWYLREGRIDREIDL